ncbi:MAG: hypothetical protein JST27_04375, partial [Bacteroidetes bacterium]|nr:hypothetical protein [Bacteroidota bacterium]
GRQLWQQHLKALPQSYSEEIDLSDTPPGNYMVTLKAEGEQLSRLISLHK